MQQSGLTAHYAWPVLPWLFMSCAAGALWIQRQSRRVALIWVLLLLCGTLIDNPAVQRVGRMGVDPEATKVLSQLDALGVRADDVVLAQPNLIPHLPHSNAMFSVGGEQAPPREPDWVLATPVGDLWPLDAQRIDALTRGYSVNPKYHKVTAGPLYAFRLRRP